MTSTDINVRTAIAAAMEAEDYLRPLNAEIKLKLVQVVECLMEGQTRMNLTALISPAGIVRYHIADSVALKSAVDLGPPAAFDRGADIGTGAGFPLIPMAILMPYMRWTGIESVQKKARYVHETAEKLGLGNVVCMGERAEDASLRFGIRDHFDVVACRAVGNSSSLLEVGMPLLKVGGCLYLHKTQSTDTEWTACQGFVKELGGENLPAYKYRLEGDNQERLIYAVRKLRPTPAHYPRAAGIPFNKPRVVL